jgi:hypothetical protein
MLANKFSNYNGNFGNLCCDDDMIYPILIDKVRVPEATVKYTKPAPRRPPTIPSQVVVKTDPADPTLSEQSTDFFAKIQQLGAVISGLKSEYRALEEKWTRELKISDKDKKKKRVANRVPSSFVKPTKISDELASFLDKPTGSEMARTAVTRDINLYIRTNSLQDKANGRKINPDSKLAELLKIDAGEELTYFNLQKYMNRHFAKK